MTKSEKLNFITQLGTSTRKYSRGGSRIFSGRGGGQIFNQFVNLGAQAPLENNIRARHQKWISQDSTKRGPLGRQEVEFLRRGRLPPPPP